MFSLCNWGLKKINNKNVFLLSIYFHPHCIIKTRFGCKFSRGQFQDMTIVHHVGSAIGKIGRANNSSLPEMWHLLNIIWLGLLNVDFGNSKCNVSQVFISYKCERPINYSKFYYIFSLVFSYMCHFFIENLW